MDKGEQMGDEWKLKNLNEELKLYIDENENRSNLESVIYKLY
jgi:hypothetical protein